MKIPPLTFAVLDTETTGFVPRVHHIVEAACVRYENGELKETYESLIAAPDEMPPHVQVLTRIKPAMLEGQPTFSQMSQAFLDALGENTLLVGQNLAFDLGMLKGEGLDLTHRPWIDTSLLASVAFPELKSYSLQYLSNALDLPHDPPHRALGDVRATAALLAAIWERLCELPATQIAEAKELMRRSSEGYRMFFEALPEIGGDGKWLERAKKQPLVPQKERIAPPKAAPGAVTLLEEPLDPGFLPALIAGAAGDGVETWIAVKNLDTAIRRHAFPDGVDVVHPPLQLLDSDAAKRMREQPTLLPEEATLSLKISWFGAHTRSELPLHAGEKDTWNGKMATTEEHPLYRKQLEGKAHVRLVDHRQLLSFLQSEEKVIKDGSRIIVDDASMLEDTATKAYGASVALDDLRAAAQGNPLLMSLADKAALWAETVKIGEDQHAITAADLSRRETQGLKQLLEETMKDSAFAPRMQYLLSELTRVLSPRTDVPMLTWIETRQQSGSVSLHSAPERIDLILKNTLFLPYATILLTPPALEGILPAVLPAEVRQELVEANESALHMLPIGFPEETLEDTLQSPPAGKTIILAGSKRMIETAFVNHTERLESEGVTLICQGLSGGQGRMESDFLASEGTTLWLLTPWMYEGIELPLGSADHLVLDSLPFDHPGQVIFARRKDRMQNGFEDYAMPRVLHRLFRLLRTFSRHKTEQGDVKILDKRMRERSYGKRVQSYLEEFAIPGAAPAFVKKTVSTTTPEPVKKPRTKKSEDSPQQSLPL